MDHTFSILVPAHAKPKTIGEEQMNRLSSSLKTHRHLCVSPHSSETGRILDVAPERINPLLADLHEAGFNLEGLEIRSSANG